MSSIATSGSSSRARSFLQEVHVRNWPFREGGPRAWILRVFCLVAPVLTGVLTRSWVATGAALVALGLASWRLWLPVRFTLSPRGLEQTSLGMTRRIRWSQIGRYEVHARGVVLYAREDTGPLSFLSAISLGWGGRREEILHVLDFYLSRKPLGSSVMGKPGVGEGSQPEAPDGINGT